MRQLPVTFASRLFPLFVCILALTSVTGCISRLRRDLFVVHDGVSTRTEVTGTHFYRGAMINPMPETQNDLILPGDENLLVLFCEHRGKKSDQALRFTLDEVIRYQLFIPMPLHLSTDTLPITDRMIAQKIGDYTMKIEDLRYLGKSGVIIIDSIASENLFAHMNGNFGSAVGDSVRFQGDFKAKIKR